MEQGQKRSGRLEQMVDFEKATLEASELIKWIYHNPKLSDGIHKEAVDWLIRHGFKSPHFNL